MPGYYPARFAVGAISLFPFLISLYIFGFRPNSGYNVSGSENGSDMESELHSVEICMRNRKPFSSGPRLTMTEVSTSAVEQCMNNG